MVKRTVPAVLILAGCLMTACRKAELEPPRHNVAPKPAVAQAYSSNTPRYYAGSIGGKYPFKMTLSLNGKAMTGKYAYDKRGSHSLALSGTHTADSSFTLEETGGGTFAGRILGDSLAGTWTHKKGRRTFPFGAKRFMPDRRTVLLNAAGLYSLTWVSGEAGANGMFDFSPEKAGKWTGSFSSVSGGMREASDLEVTEDEANFFESFRIVVGEDQAARLMLGQDTLVEFSTPKDAGFIEDRLAVAREDSVDMSELVPVSEEGEPFFFLDGDMRLDYLLLDRKLELHFDRTRGHTQYTFELDEAARIAP